MLLRAAVYAKKAGRGLRRISSLSSGSGIKDIINGRTTDRHTYVRSECPAINTAVAAERREARGGGGKEGGATGGGWRLNKISILCYEGRSSIEAEHARVQRYASRNNDRSSVRRADERA